MSWISRQRKAFLRKVESLKELPIYSIDEYIVIDESAEYYKKRKSEVDYPSIKKLDYRKYHEKGEINSSLDFDNLFNPDLTLDVVFEDDPEKENLIIHNALLEIGERWRERLSRIFPQCKYTIVIYYNSEDSEWFLDFYNGIVRITDFDGAERYTQIRYLHPTEKAEIK